jgi:hypothetical protein
VAKIWFCICLLILTICGNKALAAGDLPAAPTTCEQAARRVFQASLSTDEWLLERVYKPTNPFVQFLRKFTRGREPDWKKFNAYYSKLGDHPSLAAWEKDLANRLADGKASTEELLAFSARKIPHFRGEIERFAETDTRLRRAIFMRPAADFESGMIAGGQLSLKASSKDLDTYMTDLMGALQTAAAGKEPSHWRMLPADWVSKTLSRKQDRVIFLRSVFDEMGHQPTARQLKTLKLNRSDLDTSFDALRKHLEDTVGRRAQKDYYWLKAKTLFKTAFYLGAPYLLEKAGSMPDTSSKDTEEMSTRMRPIDPFIPQFEEVLTSKTDYDEKDHEVTLLREKLRRENSEAFAKIEKLRAEPATIKRDREIRVQIDQIKAHSEGLYNDFHFKIMDRLNNDQELLEKLKK